MKKTYKTPVCDVVVMHSEVTAFGVTGSSDGPNFDEKAKPNYDEESGETIDPDVRGMDWNDTMW